MIFGDLIILHSYYNPDVGSPPGFFLIVATPDPTKSLDLSLAMKNDNAEAW